MEAFSERDRAARPSVTVVVVSYNSEAELPACLSALAAQEGVDARVVVVDNASHDRSAALVRNDFPSAELIVNPVNTGFGRANNQILERAETDFAALVNPDAYLPSDALLTCVQHLEQHPRTAIVSTRLVNVDGTTQVSCHDFPTLTNMLGETLRLDRVLPRWRAVSEYRWTAAAHELPQRPDWIQGSFLVVRTQAIREVGGLDPDFFMYGEELEWCFRLRARGWEIDYLPEPRVAHVGGASASKEPGRMFVEHWKGRVRFFQKHRGPFGEAGVRVLLGASCLGRWALREAQVAVLRLTGRTPPGELLRRRAIFRSGAAWTLRGQPLSEAAPPPEGGGTAGADSPSTRR